MKAILLGADEESGIEAVELVSEIERPEALALLSESQHGATAIVETLSRLALVGRGSDWSVAWAEAESLDPDVRLAVLTAFGRVEAPPGKVKDWVVAEAQGEGLRAPVAITILGHWRETEALLGILASGNETEVVLAAAALAGG